MTPDELAKTGTEHAHQRALFAWARMAEDFGFAAAWDAGCYSDKLRAEQFKQTTVADTSAKLLRMLFAIPNGGERNKIVAAKLKAEGVKPGVPDLCLPVACGQFHGLFVELKKPGGTASVSQRDWARDLVAQHYYVALCYGWREAALLLNQYIKLGGHYG